MHWKRCLPLTEQPWVPSPHSGQWCLHHSPPWRQGLPPQASHFPRNKTCSSDCGTAVRGALLLKLHPSELSGAEKGSNKSKPRSLHSSWWLGPSSKREEVGIFDLVPWTKCWIGNSNKPQSTQLFLLSNNRMVFQAAKCCDGVWVRGGERRVSLPSFCWGPAPRCLHLLIGSLS